MILMTFAMFIIGFASCIHGEIKNNVRSRRAGFYLMLPLAIDTLFDMFVMPALGF